MDKNNGLQVLHSFYSNLILLIQVSRNFPSLKKMLLCLMKTFLMYFFLLFFVFLSTECPKSYRKSVLHLLK